MTIYFHEAVLDCLPQEYNCNNKPKTFFLIGWYLLLCSKPRPMMWPSSFALLSLNCFHYISQKLLFGLHCMYFAFPLFHKLFKFYKIRLVFATTTIWKQPVRHLFS